MFSVNLRASLSQMFFHITVRVICWFMLHMREYSHHYHYHCLFALLFC